VRWALAQRRHTRFWTSARGPLVQFSVVFVCLVSLLLHQAPAPSELDRYLTAATRLLEATEYEQALRQVEKAQRLATNSADEVRVSLLEGVLHGELGRTDKARQAFRAALALELSAQLPVKVSRRLKELFESVRGEFEKVRPVVTPTPIEPVRPVRADPVVTPPPPPPPAVQPIAQRSFGAPIALAITAALAGTFSAVAFGISQGQAKAAKGAFFDDDARRLSGLANGWASASLGGLLGAVGAAAVSLLFFVLAP